MNTQWSRALIWLISCWMLSTPAWANSYNKGLDAYRDGDYSKSYKILSGVVKKTKNKSDKAEAMALMGAAAAKMGKKSKAQSFFAKAVRLDSSVTLSKDVIKDKSVRKLFAKVKKSGGGGGDDEDLSLAGDGDDSGSGSDDLKEERSSGSKSSGGLGFKPFIPLGLGYLFGGEISRGLIYGGAQVGGILGYLSFQNEITKANADAAGIGEQALADKAAGKAVDQETLDFLDQNEAFVKSAQNNQKLMVFLIVGGYGLGVADGLLFGGGSKKASKKRRAEIDPILPESWASVRKQGTDTEAADTRSWDLLLELVPLTDPALMLSFNRNF